MHERPTLKSPGDYRVLNCTSLWNFSVLFIVMSKVITLDVRWLFSCALPCQQLQWGVCAGDRWICPQRARNTDNLTMLWCHCDTPNCLPKLNQSPYLSWNISHRIALNTQWRLPLNSGEGHPLNWNTCVRWMRLSMWSNAVCFIIWCIKQIMLVIHRFRRQISFGLST